jgi:tetratricopeptide (TPR) repeat protein
MTYLSTEHEKAVISLKSGLFELALEQIEAALQIHRSHPDLLAERGTIYMYLKKKEQALEDMDLALYLQPDNPYRYSSRAYVRDFFGDTEGAIEDYEKCLELDPHDIIAMNNLGLLIEKQGNRKEAKEYFKRTDELLRQNPNWQKRIASPENDQGTPYSQSQMEEKEQFSAQVSSNRSEPTHAKIIKDVFTKKSVFNEFVQFVMNGFKLK